MLRLSDGPRGLSTISESVMPPKSYVTPSRILLISSAASSGIQSNAYPESRRDFIRETTLAGASSDPALPMRSDPGLTWYIMIATFLSDGGFLPRRAHPAADLQRWSTLSGRGSDFLLSDLEWAYGTPMIWPSSSGQHTMDLRSDLGGPPAVSW